MTFHSSQVTSPLQTGSHPSARIAGHSFPAFGTDDQKIAALERAVINIYYAIDALAREVERLDRASSSQ